MSSTHRLFYQSSLTLGNTTWVLTEKPLNVNELTKQ